VGVSVLSYAGTLRVGVRSDIAAIEHPSDVVVRLERELAGFLDAAPRAAAPPPSPVLAVPEPLIVPAAAAAPPPIA
jgi:hypothetical protein